MIKRIPTKDSLAKDRPANAAFDALRARAMPADLLRWYDRHRRALPWRALPGERPDPYRVWLSEVMLQQTTVQAVKPYFDRFLALFPTVEALAAAPSEAVMTAWAGLGYYSRARNLHACAQAVTADHGGRFPDSAAGLMSLPGIGPYTAGAIAAIAFDRAEAAVDGNVERVMSRILALDEPLPGAKPVIRAATQALVPTERPGDFAQAMMDLGATICTPRRPACVLCPWQACCAARAAGTMETYPRKAGKKEGVTRRGIAFVVLREDGAILLRTRPGKGLLGGMAEVPSSPWSADHDAARALDHAPMQAQYLPVPGMVRHVFTHFPLELEVMRAQVAASRDAPEGHRFTPPGGLDAEPLPTLMRKVIALALP
jgi:A/G-specific adenine glycosylase